MLALVTGASGFVGHWLISHLESCDDHVIALPDKIDICDETRIRDFLADIQPEVIYHLAGLTHVGKSFDAPTKVFEVNALGTLHLLEAARTLVSPPRCLLVSSAEVYGTGKDVIDGNAFNEDSPLRPGSPYAASKVAAEFLGLQAHIGRGLDVVRVRPFNHVGPGQSDAFVVSALARRIVEAEISGQKSILVGNLGAQRDFTDVRDVVQAYRLLATGGIGGDVYNVCSGKAVSIAELADRLINSSHQEISLEVDPSLFRVVDVPVLRGDPKRVQALTGWKPQISLSQTLDDVLEDWRRRLR